MPEQLSLMPASTATGQTSLLDMPGARRTDLDTSHAAADQAKSQAEQHREQILTVLRRHGPATAAEIAHRTRLETHQVNRRTSELMRMDLAKDTGDRRRNAHGRKMRVLAAT